MVFFLHQWLTGDNGNGKGDASSSKKIDWSAKSLLFYLLLLALSGSLFGPSVSGICSAVKEKVLIIM